MSGTNFWIRWRVRIGYPVGIAAWWFARPHLAWFLAGAALGAMGLLLRGHAAGYLRKHEQLATTGPYAHTRNPLYLGSAVLAAGFLVASHSWISAAVVVAYVLTFYPAVIRREQAELEMQYGAAFVQYAKRVPAFLPRVSAAESVPGSFSWGLYKRNREYEATIGFALVMVLLWLRMLWR